MNFYYCPFSAEEVAPLIPEIEADKDYHAFQSEYGMNWEEYLQQDPEKVSKMIGDWWVNLPVEKKIKLIEAKISRLKVSMDYYEEYRNALKETK